MPLEVSLIQYNQNIGHNQDALVSGIISGLKPGQTFDRVLWAPFPTGQVPLWEVKDSTGKVIATGGNVGTSTIPIGYGGQVVSATGITPPPSTTVVSGSVPTINPIPSTTVQGQPNNSQAAFSGFALPNLAFGSFSNNEVWLGLGVAAVALYFFMSGSHHR